MGLINQMPIVLQYLILLGLFYLSVRLGTNLTTAPALSTLQMIHAAYIKLHQNNLYFIHKVNQIKMNNEETIPTNKGNLIIPEIMNSLYYSSYEANRAEGMTHEQLTAIGIGNDDFKLAYETKWAQKK